MTAPPAMVAAAAFASGAGAGAVLLPSLVAASPGAPGTVGLVATVGAAVAASIAPALRGLVPALAAAACCAGIARAMIGAADPSELSRAQAVAGRSAVLTGTVVDDVRATAGGFEMLVEPDGLTTSAGPAPGVGRVFITVRGPGEVLPGDAIEAAGTLVLPQVTAAFDRRAYLAQRGAHLEMRVARVDVLAHGNPFQELPGRVAALYRTGFEQLLPPPHAAIAMGSVLGIRTGTPPRLRQDLIDTGLVHLLVLSGLKVAIFTRLATAVLRPLLGRRAEPAVIPLIALYAMAGGSTPAAVRSAAMGGLALAGGWLGRPSHVWTSLALCAAAMLAWRPDLVVDVGFQLSFAGTAAIVLMTPAIERRLRWLPPVLREPFAVTVAAQVGTVPMMATDFHVVSLVGPVANAIALPVLPLLVGAGLLIAPVAAVIDPAVLRPLADVVLAAPAAWIEQVASVLDAVPRASIPMPPFTPLAGGAYYAGLGAAVLAGRSAGSRRMVGVAVALAVPVVAGGWEIAHWAAPAPRATVLDVGDGTAILVSGPGGALLFGAGPSASRLADGIGSRLPPWQRRLALVAVTGAGQRRAGGLAGSGLEASTVVMPDSALPGVAWRTAALELAGGGATVERVAGGTSMQAAGFSIEVLWPPAGWQDQASAALGFRLSGPHGSICDPGDVDLDVQVSEARALRGGCDVLVLPGGGRSAPAAELLAAAKPRWLVATAGGARLARGLPAAELRRTDLEGSIDFDL